MDDLFQYFLMNKRVLLKDSKVKIKKVTADSIT